MARGGTLPSDPLWKREKDQLLQVNRYLVLRLLAEDIGKALDRVLDTIMSAIGRTRGQLDSDLP